MKPAKFVFRNMHNYCNVNEIDQSVFFLRKPFKEPHFLAIYEIKSLIFTAASVAIVMDNVVVVVIVGPTQFAFPC